MIFLPFIYNLNVNKRLNFLINNIIIIDFAFKLKKPLTAKIKISNWIKFVLDKYKRLQPLPLDRIVFNQENTIEFNKSLTLVHSTLSLLMDFLICTSPQLLFDNVFGCIKGFLKG